MKLVVKLLFWTLAVWGMLSLLILASVILAMGGTSVLVPAVIGLFSFPGWVWRERKREANRPPPTDGRQAEKASIARWTRPVCNSSITFLVAGMVSCQVGSIPPSHEKVATSFQIHKANSADVSAGVLSRAVAGPGYGTHQRLGNECAMTSR